MGALLAHYKTNDIPNEEKIKKFRLLRPLTVLGDGTKGKTITIPQEIPDIYAVPHKPSPAPRSRNVVGRRDARSIDNNDEDADLNPDGILSPEVLNKRPPAPLPAMTEEDTPTYDSHYYYIVPDEECNRLPELRKLLELDEDMRKRCTCGLLSADSHLPDGWEVHLSTDTSTKGRIFFVSPDGRSHWNLPVSIYKKLSDEQREYLSDLFAKDKTRTKATERVSTCWWIDHMHWNKNIITSFQCERTFWGSFY